MRASAVDDDEVTSGRRPVTPRSSAPDAQEARQRDLTVVRPLRKSDPDFAPDLTRVRPPISDGAPTPPRRSHPSLPPPEAAAIPAPRRSHPSLHPLAQPSTLRSIAPTAQPPIATVPPQLLAELQRAKSVNATRRHRMQVIVWGAGITGMFTAGLILAALLGQRSHNNESAIPQAQAIVPVVNHVVVAEPPAPLPPVPPPTLAAAVEPTPTVEAPKPPAEEKRAPVARESTPAPAAGGIVDLQLWKTRPAKSAAVADSVPREVAPQEKAPVPSRVVAPAKPSNTNEDPALKLARDQLEATF